MSDDMIRDRMSSSINAYDSEGTLRNRYLNKNTLGYVLLDIEYPVNFGSIWNHTEDTITWFVEGLIRRINIFREFCPHAKVGIWRYGDGLNPFNTTIDTLEDQIQNMRFAANVRYEGKKFYDALDFLSPAIYSYGSGAGWGADEERAILSGYRTGSTQKVCNEIITSQGSHASKPVVPLFTFDINGEPHGWAGELNKVELNNLRNYDHLSHFVAWHSAVSDDDCADGGGMGGAGDCANLENFEISRARLIREIDALFPKRIIHG